MSKSKKRRKQPFVILSCDGGGTRGMFSAYFLRLLQSKLPLPIHMYVDLLAGTSTGSIVAGLVGMRQIRFDHNMRKYYDQPCSPLDVIEIYQASIGTIFSREVRNPYVSKMAGAAAVMAVMIGIQMYRRKYDNPVTTNTNKQSLISRILIQYLDPTLFFFRKFFTGSTSSSSSGNNKEIFRRKFFWNSLVFVACHSIIKNLIISYTSQQSRPLPSKGSSRGISSSSAVYDKDFLPMGSSYLLNQTMKASIYIFMFYSALTSMSKPESSSSTSTSTSVEDFGFIRHGLLFCGIFSGIGGFLSGVFSGITKWNSPSQTIMKGAAQGVISTLFGATSAACVSVIFKMFSKAFGSGGGSHDNDNMSSRSRIIMMLLCGVVTGLLDGVLLHTVETFVKDLFSPKYPESALPKILTECFGDETTLSTGAVTNMIFTTFDIRTTKPVFFDHTSDVLAYKAVTASASAPTFFRPLKLMDDDFRRNEHKSRPTITPMNSPDHLMKMKRSNTDTSVSSNVSSSSSSNKPKSKHVLVDGALFANNPSLLAYSYAKQNGITDDQIFLISVGTGRYIRKPSKSFKECGGLEWLSTVLDVSMDGSDTNTILKAIFHRKKKNYVRIQYHLDKKIEIDTTDTDFLLEEAKRIAEREDWEHITEQIAKRLVEFRKLRKEKIILEGFKGNEQGDGDDCLVFF